jgi:hypothetical protein
MKSFLQLQEQNGDRASQVEGITSAKVWGTAYTHAHTHTHTHTHRHTHHSATPQETPGVLQTSRTHFFSVYRTSLKYCGHLSLNYSFKTSYSL